MQNGERTKVQDMIAQVRDDTLRAVLTKHYAGGMTWERIAEELSYTPRHIQRLNKKALAEIQGILSSNA